MHHRAFGLLALVASAPFAFAQTGEDVPPPQPPQFDSLLSDWQGTHGPSWRALTDQTTGRLEMLYGGNAAAPFPPDVSVDEDWFTLARYWVAETWGMHGIEDHELTEVKTVYLPLGMANGTDKITVRMSQHVQGLPVENGFVNVLFDTHGRLLSIHTTAAPDTGAIVIAPKVNAAGAKRTARSAFEAEVGAPALQVGAALLHVAQVVTGNQRHAHLAYKVEVRNDAEPFAKTVHVDAMNGAVLRMDEEIHNFDVTGEVRSMATPGTAADHAGNPPAEFSMSYINVSGSNGQTVQTDRDGNFTFPGVNSAIDITLTFNGTFNNVDNDAGSDYSITFPSVQPNQANVLLMNPVPGELRTAQANAYQHVNVLRDYIRDTIPSDNTADFKATSNANLNSNCNAFFNGGSVNFYTAGGGCNNTAFSSVVAHEMGHWLNVRYNTGNGGDGMGEGNADMFAMYTYDDHIVGRFFSTGGGFVRSGLNTRQFCGDSNPGCYGGVHADGEVWMGAGWKVRRNLKNTLGTGLGGSTADQLFMGWMNGYNQSTIRSIITTQWLTLDDDNGDIGDGTPNYQDINDAFLEQGFPGVDLDFFGWSNVTNLPDVSTDNGPYTVNADVVALLSGPVTGVDVLYSVNGGSTMSAAMAPAGGNTWTGDIPSLGGLGIVNYWLEATDNGGNSETYPDGSALTFTVGDETILYSYDFETAGNQGWQGHIAGDDASTGQWTKGDPIGTAAQSENDHTPGLGNTDCWFTGQGSNGGSIGENDVDGGQTTLLSPVFDLSGASIVNVSYWRWYSNDEGSSPNADTFLVQLSNDGGGSWTTVETVGPTGPQASGEWFQGSFLADSVLPMTSQMRVQFIASDLGSGSIVEAAVDDFEISVLSPGCAAPENYCVLSPNSVGAGAQMVGSGSQDVADNSFSIAVFGCPPSQFGLFFYGPNQVQNSVGDGTICIGNPLFRLPAQQVTVFGDAFRTLDMNNLPAGGDIMNGDTMNFSFWYRDLPGGPAGYNFADGLSVTFCGN